MKTNFGKLFIATVVVATFSITSCKKEGGEGGGSLRGNTDIALTQVDSVTSISVTVNGESVPMDVDVKVVSNDKGMVTYGATVNLNSVPDSFVNALATMAPALIDYYNPKDVNFNISPSGELTFSFKVKVTSEGMQNYFVEGKPWTAKYGDPVGTQYKVERDNGDVLTSTVTEKTGQDDWSYGFMYIKTSKLEYNAPVSDPVLDNVSYRINHKFGLVYLKIVGKDGKEYELDLFPYFLLL